MSLPRRRIPRVTPAELPTLLATLLMAVVVEVGLRVTTLPRLARLLGTTLVVDGAGSTNRPMDRGPVAPLPPRAVKQLQAIRRVLRHWPFGDTCLRQALVGGGRLRRLDPSLVVGVAKIDGEVRAHSWLLVNGTVVDPLFAAASYQPLTSISTGLAT
ncbi:lasso peptide biosynthesis B2 protein [Nocardioides sp. YIM 152315]|uniref:lasso peptide biosynthesis B2 protein n=1 Tax=Nocardioides sp. YIM 152315 TaxID=3031760 RepID=UPI0023DC4688|nr:lasso peptide biosynthesis B2 protein [Nocardioides sp. YIM 152315]MDF1603439.1 lasso peptide biosynthesis B2 protein [Nocardioides sp. YIM 152315]